MCTRLMAVLIMVAPLYGAAASFRNTVERWGQQEVSITSVRNYENPFAEVEFSAVFRSGTTEVRAEGFYDGDHTWRVRLMPAVEGRWSFATSSNNPELDGKHGEFIVTPASDANHGPIVVRNTYHFAYADGTPYFPLGTTLYNWLHRETSLQMRTLATLATSPFNKIRCCVFPKWYRYNRVEPPLYPYVKTGDNKFDFKRFNPAYFRHIEQRLLDVQGLGIEADLILFHPYDHWGYENMGQENDDAYLHYVIARLAPLRNVWWTMANEWDFVKPSKDWDHIFQLVAKLDPYDHPRAIHNGFRFYDHSKPWVTHCNIQDGLLDQYETTVDARRRYHKPVLVDEYGYEGNNGQGWGNLSGFEEMRRHWKITMAGGYASHGETYVHPGDILWWAVGGELIGESPARLGFLREVMTAAPYEEMETAPDSVTDGYALAKPGEYYFFYFGKAATHGRLRQILAGRDVYNGGISEQDLRSLFQQSRRPEKPAITIPGDGAFLIEAIDPWLMEVYRLGYVRPGSYPIVPLFRPIVFRAIRKDPPAGLKPGSLEEALSRWKAASSR